MIKYLFKFVDSYNNEI